MRNTGLSQRGSTVRNQMKPTGTPCFPKGEARCGVGSCRPQATDEVVPLAPPKNIQKLRLPPKHPGNGAFHILYQTVKKPAQTTTATILWLPLSGVTRRGEALKHERFRANSPVDCPSEGQSPGA